MHPTRRATAITIAVFVSSFGLVACGSTAATPGLSTVPPPAPSTGATVRPTSAPPTFVPVPTPLPSAAGTAPPSAPTTAATSSSSPAPVPTLVPGSSLDPSLSDAGVVGRIIITNDTRNGLNGVHDIAGVADDSSSCGYSLDGKEFTAVAWYDEAPNSMLHQMSVTVSTDFVPANDGEQRMGITDGSVYADFVTESGFGTAYAGAQEAGDGSSSTIDAALVGDTLVFTFSGTTWDGIAISGQMACSGMTGGGPG